MPTRYDPGRAPDPQRWLAEKELDLIGLVERWHRRERIPLPSPRVHAAVHVMIENQVALGAQTPVAEALERLMGEGLSRHDAVHAVGAVLHKHMHRALATQQPVRCEAYYDDVRTDEGRLARRVRPRTGRLSSREGHRLPARERTATQGQDRWCG